MSRQDDCACVDGCALAHVCAWAHARACGRGDRRTAYPERSRRQANIHIFFELMLKLASFDLGLVACCADTQRVPANVRNGKYTLQNEKRKQRLL